MKLSTNRAVFLFLRENWLIALLLLLLLWLLPKLVNAYALLLNNLRHWLGALENAPGNLLRNTAKGAREAIDTLLSDFTPGTGLVITAAAVAVTPAPVRIFLLAWQLIDFFKGDEQVTVTRESGPAPVPPPVNQPPLDFGGF